MHHQPSQVPTFYKAQDAGFPALLVSYTKPLLLPAIHLSRCRTLLDHCYHLLLLLPPQVSYFYDADLGDFYYGPTHPMKPHRVRMAHDLIVRYDLYKHLQVGSCRAGWYGMASFCEG
jgi:hypothetical protein